MKTRQATLQFIALMSLAKHMLLEKMLHYMDLHLLCWFSLQCNIFHVFKPVTGITLIYVNSACERKKKQKRPVNYVQP